MKPKQFVILFLFPLILISCGLKGESTSIQPSIYTAVAETLTANPTKTPVEANQDTAISTEEIQNTPTPEAATQQATATRVIVTSAPGDCNEATYVSDVTIPDNTLLSPGASFTKTWIVKNTGSCTWTTDYELKFVNGSQMSGATTHITAAVAPQTSAQVSVDLVAPSTAGTYTGYWQMADDSGSLFGDSLYLTIIIAATPTGTITSTTTITLTPTITPTRTNTPVYIIITATPGPSDTPVPTATRAPTSTTKTTAPTKTQPPTSVPTQTPVPPTAVPTNPPVPATAVPTDVPATETPVPTA